MKKTMSIALDLVIAILHAKSYILSLSLSRKLMIGNVQVDHRKKVKLFFLGHPSVVSLTVYRVVNEKQFDLLPVRTPVH